MKSLKLTLIAGMSALALVACSSKAPTETPAEDTTVVQDETMAPEGAMADAAGDKNIVALAQSNADVSTLVSAVTAAGLAETLSGPGPFTVFAPTNAAFAKVDKAALGSLMEPANKAKLADLLKYHVVSGTVKAADVVKMITDGKGTATIKTLAGGELKASMDGDKVILTDGKGMKSTVTGTDMAASNGVVHTIDTVLMPK
jgi:uncharacterized surface protein with fasciclin (FAS1) repeats